MSMMIDSVVYVTLATMRPVASRPLVQSASITRMGISSLSGDSVATGSTRQVAGFGSSLNTP